MRKGTLLAILSVLVVALLVAGCGGSGGTADKAAEKPVAGGSLTYGESAELDSLDPQVGYESVSMQINRAVFDGLVDYDPKTLKAMPAVAKSWKVSPDAQTFTFTLNKGIKFHNGRELKAADVVYSFNRLVAAETQSPWNYMLEAVAGAADVMEGKAKTLKGVKAVDDYTVEVKLDYPFADFVIGLAHVGCSIIPQEEVKKWGGDFGKHPVGCGPYKFKGWKIGQAVDIEKFKDYYGQPGNLDSITVKFFGNADTAYKEFQAGSLDFIPNVPSGQIEEAKAMVGENFISKPEMSFYYYGFNTSRKPFDDVKLRKAIAYSVDAKAAVETVKAGNAKVATGIVPPVVEGYTPAKTDISYDAKKAEEGLKAAGVKIPYKLELNYSSGGEFDKFNQAIQARMGEAKVSASLKSLEQGAYFDMVSKGELPFFTSNWIADYPSPDAFLYSMFHSSLGPDMNSSQYKNEEVDGLLDKARGELDEAKRMALYKQAEEKILADMPVIPLYWGKSAYAFQQNVGGAWVDAMSYVPLERLWKKAQ